MVKLLSISLEEQMFLCRTLRILSVGVHDGVGIMQSGTQSSAVQCAGGGQGRQADVLQ